MPAYAQAPGPRDMHDRNMDMSDSQILQHHLVREGLTMDCTGLDYRMQLLLKELEDEVWEPK